MLHRAHGQQALTHQLQNRLNLTHQNCIACILWCSHLPFHLLVFAGHDRQPCMHLVKPPLVCIQTLIPHASDQCTLVGTCATPLPFNSDVLMWPSPVPSPCPDLDTHMNNELWACPMTVLSLRSLLDQDLQQDPTLHGVPITCIGFRANHGEGL